MNTTKPGYKTTEFWTTLATAIFGMLMMSGIISKEDSDTLILSINNIVGGLMTAGPVIGYAISRGKAKTVTSQSNNQKTPI